MVNVVAVLPDQAPGLGPRLRSALALSGRPGSVSLPTPTAPSGLSRPDARLGRVKGTGRHDDGAGRGWSRAVFTLGLAVLSGLLGPAASVGIRARPVAAADRRWDAFVAAAAGLVHRLWHYPGAAAYLGVTTRSPRLGSRYRPTPADTAIGRSRPRWACPRTRCGAGCGPPGLEPRIFAASRPGSFLSLTRAWTPSFREDRPLPTPSRHSVWQRPPRCAGSATPLRPGRSSPR